MGFPAQPGQLKTGHIGKGPLQNHLWCPKDLARLWDRLNKTRLGVCFFNLKHRRRKV